MNNLRYCYQSYCLVPMLRRLATVLPGVRGMLMCHMDFWFHPSHIMHPAAFDQVWQLDGGLVGPKPVPLFGLHCVPLEAVIADDNWWWWGISRRHA